MIRKLHTKPDFNTASSLLTNIKSIGANSLLVTMFALFTMIVSTTPAQAELVDLSSPEPIIQLPTQDASWRRPPRFENIPAYLNKYLIHCSYDQDGNVIKPCDRKDLKMVFSLRVDKQGSIRNVKVIESSGIKKIDNAFSRELQEARFKPFLREGKAVVANIELPIVFRVP